MAPPRLDQLLVERGLAQSRASARRAIKDGAVTVDGLTASKPARRTASSVAIEVDQQAQRVGRGGRKLAYALARFPIELEGRRAFDAGASTGGFTEELLRAGVASVHAVDVGHGQLAPELAGDTRVTNIEGTNVRALTSGALGAPFDLLVADLSFISLTKVASGLTSQISLDADVILLVKPQFEVGPLHVDRGGIVRSGAAREQALLDVAASWQALGWHVHDAAVSPVRGGDGNIEFLVWLRHGEGPPSVAALRAVAAEETL